LIMGAAGFDRLELTVGKAALGLAVQAIDLHDFAAAVLSAAALGVGDQSLLVAQLDACQGSDVVVGSVSADGVPLTVVEDLESALRRDVALAVH
jgi:hypothetical protein